MGPSEGTWQQGSLVCEPWGQASHGVGWGGGQVVQHWSHSAELSSGNLLPGGASSAKELVIATWT